MFFTLTYFFIPPSPPPPLLPKKSYYWRCTTMHIIRGFFNFNTIKNVFKWLTTSNKLMVSIKRYSPKQLYNRRPFHFVCFFNLTLSIRSKILSKIYFHVWCNIDIKENFLCEPKKINEKFHKMSSYTWNFTCVFTILGKFDINFLRFPWEIVFGAITDN